mmetsp:Transcript_63207/g.150741  ORF Transcript_63207/g.150741 Transcript_63207/m.150741 type:complete len:228 (-) Transcript_63207:107-790(-)
MLAVVEDEVVGLVVLHFPKRCAHYGLSFFSTTVGNHDIDMSGVPVVSQCHSLTLRLVQHEASSNARHKSPPSGGLAPQLCSCLGNSVAILHNLCEMSILGSGDSLLIHLCNIVNHDEMVVEVNELNTSKEAHQVVDHRAQGPYKIDRNEAVIALPQGAYVCHLTDDSLVVHVESWKGLVLRRRLILCTSTPLRPSPSGDEVILGSPCTKSTAPCLDNSMLIHSYAHL